MCILLVEQQDHKAGGGAEGFFAQVWGSMIVHKEKAALAQVFVYSTRVSQADWDAALVLAHWPGCFLLREIGGYS